MWLYGGNDIYTKLLIHGEEVVTSNEFIESSLGGKTVTVINAVQSTEQYKFGTKSWYFDGTGDYLSLADSDDWNFGSGNFTIDGWERFPATPTGIEAIVGQGVDGNNYWLLILRADQANKYLEFHCYSGASKIITVNTNGGALTWNQDQWYHIAVVRNGNDYTIYVDGVSKGTATDTDAIPDFAASLIIGIDPGDKSSYPFNGWIDGFRISKGVARWTSDFTPPALPYGLNTPRIISVS